jgi:hypothetical protein
MPMFVRPDPRLRLWGEIFQNAGVQRMCLKRSQG